MIFLMVLLYGKPILLRMLKTLKAMCKLYSCSNTDINTNTSLKPALANSQPPFNFSFSPLQQSACVWINLSSPFLLICRHTQSFTFSKLPVTAIAGNTEAVIHEV